MYYSNRFQFRFSSYGPEQSSTRFNQ